MAIFAVLCYAVVEGPNLALNAPATQSSTYGGCGAWLAADGDYSSGSCTSTIGGQSWWSVDLGTPQYITTVNVTNDANVNFRKYTLES